MISQLKICKQELCIPHRALTFSLVPKDVCKVLRWPFRVRSSSHRLSHQNSRQGYLVVYGGKRKSPEAARLLELVSFWTTDVSVQNSTQLSGCVRVLAVVSTMDRSLPAGSRDGWFSAVTRCFWGKPKEDL